MKLIDKFKKWSGYPNSPAEKYLIGEDYVGMLIICLVCIGVIIIAGYKLIEIFLK